MAESTNLDVTGSYVRQNPSNPWHFGIISQTGAQLTWSNRAGRSWNLIPDLPNSRLQTDTSNPYNSTSPTFDLVVTNGVVTGFRFNTELYRRIAIKTDPMIPLRLNDGPTENGIAFKITLVGEAIKATTGYSVLFDTGSWSTSVPLSILDETKITYLNKDKDGKPIQVMDTWSKPCYEVSGQLGAWSADGKTKYVVDGFQFLARVNDGDNRIICGAFPSPDPAEAAYGPGAVLGTLLPSLPYALAQRYSPKDSVGLGIVSVAPDLPVNDGWKQIKCYVQLGGAPEITDVLQWRTDVPNAEKTVDFCPEAVPGFTVSITFPGQVSALIASGLSATVDTGASNIRMRIGDKDPHLDDAHKAYFVAPDPDYYYDGTLVKAVKPDSGARVRVTFEDSNRMTSFYEYPPTNSPALKVPTKVLVGSWNGKFPWPVDDSHPQTRIDIGNTIYYFCPVYYWDVTNKRVGIYFAR